MLKSTEFYNRDKQTRFKKSTYLWRGTNSYGQTVSGEITAFSPNLAKMTLAKNGVDIFFIQKKRIPLFWKNQKITSTDLVLFFRQFSTLVMAGIPIAQAIYILNQYTEQSKISFLLISLKEDITAGNSLASGLKKFPRYFDQMTCSLIYAGEKTGTLELMLARIAQHKEKLATLKNKIKQALFYPMLILCVAVIVTIIMLTFIVPHFAELFHSMHSTLPAFTEAVICLGNFLHHYLMVFILILLFLASLLYIFRKTPQIQWVTDTLLLKLPVFGPAYQKFILSGFSHSLATLFAAGIPITEALTILTSSTGNLLYTRAINALYLDISIGKQLHFAMKACKLFPLMMLQMIQIGEESGMLEKMLLKTAEFYESDLDHLTSQLSRLLEPLIMVVLGIVIGGLVIAMYLPIFKLGTVI